MAKKTGRIIFWGYMSIAIVFILYFLVTTIVPRCINRMEYKTAGSLPITYGIVQCDDRAKFRKDIEELAGWQQYFYQEKDLNGVQRYGQTNIAIRRIIMHNDLPDFEYMMYFTHEYLHLRLFTACERYINFQAFKLLYESGNETYKQVALQYASQDMCGWIPYDYSCWGQIYEYLKDKI